MTENTNPANFANRLKEEVHQRAAKPVTRAALPAWIPTSRLVIFVEYFQPPGRIQEKSLLLWPEAEQYVRWSAMLDC